MDAELIAVGGSLSGMRFPLAAHEVRAGRSPDAEIRLQDSGAAWEHCIVRPAAGGHCVIDRQRQSGTFVNGRGNAECRLEPGDRISVGETVLLYRQAGAAGNHGLLQACSLLFLFRALATTENEGYRDTIEAQLIELLSEMVPCAGCAVTLGKTAEDVRAAAPVHLKGLVMEALSEGSAVGAHAVAVGLWVRGTPAGVLAAWFAPEDSTDLQAQRDALGAVATLAVTALEAERDLDRLRSENRLLRERVEAVETG